MTSNIINNIYSSIFSSISVNCRHLTSQSAALHVTDVHVQKTGLEQKDIASYKGQLLFGRYPCCGHVMFPCRVVTPYQSGPRQMPDGAPLSPTSFCHFIPLHCILAVNSHSVLLNYSTHTHAHAHERVWWLDVWNLMYSLCVSSFWLSRWLSCDFIIGHGHFLFIILLIF